MTIITSFSVTGSGDRITLKTEYSEEDAERILRCKLPKLTLQPIVENAVCHGVEQMIGNGIITIRVDITDDHMIIKVSDNGIGMPEERVKELNHKLNELKTEYIKDDHENKGGIAMVNVNNRIRLFVRGGIRYIYLQHSSDGNGCGDYPSGD